MAAQDILPAMGPILPVLALQLVCAHVLAPDGEHWLAARITIEGERITAVESAPGAEESPELKGLYLVPGLIDLHTHLLLHAYDETSWDDQVLKESLELRTIRATKQALDTLRAGFTTVRELGTDGAGFADVALRDAIRQGIVAGPTILAATRAIVATGCYGPAGFDPRFAVPKGAQEADGADGVRKAVREQLAAGADWIKVYADYRRAPGQAATATFSIEELQAAVEEARSAGKHVAAHASTDEGIRRAVQAGVATIEHGTEASEGTLRLMKEHETVLVPTLAAVEAIARYGGWKAGDAISGRLARAEETVRKAHELGVLIACGSDAGVFAHGKNSREIELLVDCGLTNAEALRAATSVAARVLGREKDLGRIEQGFLADLVALQGDPLKDRAALREVRGVWKAGRSVPAAGAR
jgi:imidazolonepropionase-like amidohydrolase